MTKAELFKLPFNKKTVEYLRSPKVFFEYPGLYNELILGINSYLSLPKAVKSIIKEKPTIEKVYIQLEEIKKAGYRKELILLPK